ncbi:MAG: hypothetical protein JW891_09705 [Candidatus Lokiarchaeota archaeon]|nr:hypothetical protein [Candidatus Lokiarchaeota archaeon]
MLTKTDKVTEAISADQSYHQSHGRFHNAVPSLRTNKGYPVLVRSLFR